MPAAVINRDEVHLGYIDLSKKELRQPVAQNAGSDPASPVEGQFFWRTDTKKWRVYNGTAWEDLGAGAGAISATIADAKGDLIVATAADTVARKAVGADGTFLVAASGQSDGLQWRIVADADLPSTVTRDSEVFLLSAYTTKGDIGIATAAGAVSRHGVGANGTFLVANSANGDGWENRAITAADISEKLATTDLTDWPRSAALDLNSQKITGLADGTATTDAATFGQLSAVVNGQDWKNDPADAATTAALPAVTATTTTLTASANGALAAQDGVTLAVGDTLLVKNQAAGAQNGIYTVTQLGAAGAPFILTRRADADNAAELTDATILVDAGTDNKGDIYTFPTITTLGTTDATPAKTGEGNTIYAADGSTLALTGVTFSVASGGITATQLNASVAGDGLAGGGGTALSVNTGTGLEKSADAVRIATSAAGNGLTGGGGSALAVNAGTGILADGTSTRINPTVVMKGASGTLTGGANSEVITHNLNTRKIKVVLRNNASPYDEVDIYNEATSVNTATVYAATGQSLPAGYSWLVMGVE